MDSELNEGSKVNVQQEDLTPADGVFDLVSWTAPTNMTPQKWAEVGAKLKRQDGAVQWWFGDWWAFGEHKYGARQAMTQAPDWRGPAFQTCAQAARVCRAFATCRRRQVLTFKHHREVVGLPLEQADALLNWAEHNHVSANKLRERVAGDRRSSSNTMTRDEVIAVLMKRCDDEHLSKEAGRRMRYIAMRDLVLARKVVGHEISIDKAYKQIQARARNEREREQTAHNAALAAASSARQSGNGTADLEKNKQLQARSLANAIATLRAVADTRIAPAYLMEQMSNDEKRTVATHTPHVIRFLRYVVNTWANNSQENLNGNDTPTPTSANWPPTTTARQ